MIGSGTPKLEWQELPREIRATIESYLGAPVVQSETRPGGFSPGVAAKVVTARGKKAFIKSSSSSISKPSADVNRREIKHTRALQDNSRVPKLLHSFEKGDWVSLICEVVEGRHPQLPWVDEELDLVLSELTELSASLSPCPSPELFSTLESGQETFSGWSHFSKERELLQALKDPWIERKIDTLVRLEGSWTEAAQGNCLIHTEIRADQIPITYDKAIFLDWPHAKIGAPWVDFLFLFPSIVMQKGPSMRSLVTRSPLAQVPASKLFPMAAALAGFFLWNSLQPPLPRLVTLREFQRSQGEVVIRWLEESGV
jgi:aminoglycoside phosphotransferase (APT) family kinase protein